MGEEQEAGAADPRPLTAEAVEAALLGRTASMVSREVSAEAEVSLARARRLWHALGFQVVDDDAAMFTEAVPKGSLSQWKRRTNCPLIRESRLLPRSVPYVRLPWLR